MRSPDFEPRRGKEARSDIVARQVASVAIDQLGANVSVSDITMNRNGIRAVAEQQITNKNGGTRSAGSFQAFDQVAGIFSNGNGLHHKNENVVVLLDTKGQILKGSHPRTVAPKNSEEPVQTQQQNTIQDPPIRDEARGVRIDMFLPENGQDVDEGKLAAEFFGYGRKWRAAYANPESFKKREEAREQRILGENPDKKTLIGYRKKREKQIDISDRFAAKSINTRFRRAVATHFDTGGRDPMEFAEEHLDHAADAQRYALKTLFAQRGAVRQRNESILPIIDPDKIVETMSSEKSSSTIKVETRNRFLRAFISADISTFNRGREARRKLTMIQDLLNERLFAGMTASTVNVTVRAIFDDVTNAINFVDGVDGKIPDEAELPEGKHIKNKVLPMRPIEGSGLLVYTNPSEKTQASSIMKAMKKALVGKSEGKGELIAGAEEVQDINRIMFAVHGNEEDRDGLLERVFNVLVENQHRLAERDIEGRPILPRGGNVIQDISPDDKTDGLPGQSKNYRSRRLQVNIGGQMIEIKFQTMEEFLEGEYEVGTFDKKKNKFTGAAHGLYEIQRLIDLLPYITPQLLYRRLNLKKEAIKTLKAKAEEFKTKR